MKLPVYDADPERVARIRARCVSVLEARRSRVGDRRPLGRRGWLEPAVAVGLGVLYLADAVARAVVLYASR
jgi:hypothetical protein